jgi:hypothetical protein
MTAVVGHDGGVGNDGGGRDDKGKREEVVAVEGS